MFISEEVKIALGAASENEQPHLLCGISEGNEIVVCGAIPLAGENESEWKDNADIQIEEVNRMMSYGMRIVAISCLKKLIFKLGSIPIYVNPITMVSYDCRSQSQNDVIKSVNISKYITLSGMSTTTTLTETVPLRRSSYKKDPRLEILSVVDSLKEILKSRIEKSIQEEGNFNNILSFHIPDVVSDSEMFDNLVQSINNNEPDTLAFTVAIPVGEISGFGETIKSVRNSVICDVKDSVLGSLDEFFENIESFPPNPSDLLISIPKRRVIITPFCSLRGITKWHGYGSKSEIRERFNEVCVLKEIKS